MEQPHHVVAVPQGQDLINCTDMHLVNQTRSIIASLKAASGLLIIVRVLRQTFNDVPRWTVFKRIPEIHQLFDIVQLGLIMYRHVELLLEAMILVHHRRRWGH